jgi:hypothetical protein
MIFFCIKKSFFDLWDNLLGSFALNIVSTSLLAIPVFLFAVRPFAAPLPDLAITGAGFLPFFLYLPIVCRFAGDVSGNAKIEPAKIHMYFARGGLPCIAYWLLVVSVAILVSIALPAYVSSDSIESIPFFAITAIATFFFLLTIQYVMPLHILYEPKILRAIKKSFRFFMDNPGFTLGVAVGSLVIIGVSVATLTLSPGIMGLLVWHHTCFSMRMLKYEYLEAHPEASRNRLPWKEILAFENEKLGTRTLRNTIFPWME